MFTASVHRGKNSCTFAVAAMAVFLLFPSSRFTARATETVEAVNFSNGFQQFLELGLPDVNGLDLVEVLDGPPGREARFNWLLESSDSHGVRPK